MREFRWAATQNKTREYSPLGDRRQVFEMAGTGGKKAGHGRCVPTGIPEKDNLVRNGEMERTNRTVKTMSAN